MKCCVPLCIVLSLISPVRSEPIFTLFPATASATTLSTSDRILARAFKNKTSGFMVKFRGTVIRKLADDLIGSRHQRFIVKLESGQTLLIAHNIDLAPRVASLKTGNAVSVYGEYVWNREGGIIHKTHHHTDGSKGGGSIRHKGVVYQ
jgi:hypothetical protein